jgi:hypothetical protein
MRKLYITLFFILAFYALKAMSFEIQRNNYILQSNTYDSKLNDTIKLKKLHKDVVLLAQPLRDHNFPNIADTIGKFYIDDNKTIELLIQDWFHTSSKNVGYGEKYQFTYSMSFCKNGLVEDFFFINLPSEFIYIENEYRNFDSSLFTKYRHLYKPVIEKDTSFLLLTEARMYLKKLKSNPELITYSCKWEIYDGEFIYNMPLFDNPPSSEEMIEQLTQELTKQFPQENFKIQHHTQLSNSHAFRIYGNESLFIKMKENASAWNSFSLKLYWYSKN